MYTIEAVRSTVGASAVAGARPFLFRSLPSRPHVAVARHLSPCRRAVHGTRGSPCRVADPTKPRRRDRRARVRRRPPGGRTSAPPPPRPRQPPTRARAALTAGAPRARADGRVSSLPRRWKQTQTASVGAFADGGGGTVARAGSPHHPCQPGNSGRRPPAAGASRPKDPRYDRCGRTAQRMSTAHRRSRPTTPLGADLNSRPFHCPTTSPLAETRRGQ